MREILFRGKRIDNGEWLEGYYGFDDNKPLIAINKANGINGYFVAAETVGQYTGLTDKNGKKIFEGDILELICCGESYRDVVVYGRWNCSCCDGVYGYALSQYDEQLDFREAEGYEICGNIHDNPELLEDKS